MWFFFTFLVSLNFFSTTKAQHLVFCAKLVLSNRFLSFVVENNQHWSLIMEKVWSCLDKEIIPAWWDPLRVHESYCINSCCWWVHFRSASYVPSCCSLTPFEVVKVTLFLPVFSGELFVFSSSKYSHLRRMFLSLDMCSVSWLACYMYVLWSPISKHPLVWSGGCEMCWCSGSWDFGKKKKNVSMWVGMVQIAAGE